MTQTLPRVLGLTVLISLVGASVLGAQPSKPTTGTAKPETSAAAKPEPSAKQEKPRGEKAAREEAAQQDRERAQQFIQGPNVRIELTLTEQQGASGPASSKTVMLTTGNEQWGKLRSTGWRADVGGPKPLNLDARPVVLKDGRIWVTLTVEYSPEGKGHAQEPATTAAGGEGAATSSSRTQLDQSLGVVLQNAQPLVVAQAADAVSDRRITVEVKATVLK